MIFPKTGFHFSGSCPRCRSSVVEHSLGKGEVVSSILTGSTSFQTRRRHARRARFPGRGVLHEQIPSRMRNLSQQLDVLQREELLEDAMNKAIICAFALSVLATPALADEYWVVQDSSTKHCSIVTSKPTTTTTTVIGNTAFKTRTEAESSMKTTKVCSSD